MKPADLTADIIRRLLESFIDHTRDLHVEPAGDDQLIEWLIEVHQDDQRKVIGAKGSHIKALKFIVSELGLAVGADYRLKLRDRPTPEFPERSAPKLAKSYDVTGAATLLADLLFQLTPKQRGDIRVTCTNGMASPKNPLSFTFTIEPSAGGAETLNKQDEAGDQTLLGAVGTIFRAYANREGVAFKLEVATVKAISLWQPWASALFAGNLKPDETRHWRMPLFLIGQDIAIHAAKRDTRQEREFWEEIADTSDLEAFKAMGISTYEQLPRGCIIGTMAFSHSLPTANIRQSRELFQREWGDYTDGRFAWPQIRRNLFQTPIPCVGRQGFFDWNPKLMSAEPTYRLPCGGRSLKTGKRVGFRHRWNGSNWCQWCDRSIEQVTVTPTPKKK